MRPMARLRLSLASRILVFQLAIILGALLMGGVVSALVASAGLDSQYENRALNVAESVAQLPSVRDALRDSDPSRILQPLAEGMRKASGASFIVIAGPDGTRYSHPNPALIGKPIDEDPAAILKGQTFKGIQRGTLGTSARGKAPIFDGTGRVVGIVSVGFLETGLSRQLLSDLSPYIPQVAVYLLVAVGLGVIGSLLLARHLKRQTFGLEPEEISTLLEQREASLHGIREGTVAADLEGRITLMNDEARRLLRLPEKLEGKRLIDVLPPGRVRDVLSGEVTGADEVVLALLLGKSAVAAERGIQFRLSPDSRLDGDAGHPRDLITVVGNLIDNALDAVASSANVGPRWVEVSIRQDEGDVVIKVHDSGPGIALDDTEQIFSEGYTTKVAAPGSRRGLGLALVKQVAARRDGRVTVVNQGGAMFTVRLPLASKPLPVVTPA